ncbi:hypothetical protein Aperf_G00000047870 [Anoplocephala perfoliata]
MLSKSTINRVLCVLHSQVLFFVSLICMGLTLIITSTASLCSIYWSCAVLNLYYTEAWLCLAIGILQVLLGTGIGVYVCVQPKCAKNKDHLVLVGPEGNQLGEFAVNGVQNSTNYQWTLRVSPNHQKSHSCCRCFCCCRDDNKSAFANISIWFRSVAIIFFLLFAAQLAAISLNASQLSQAQNSEIGLLSEIRTIFIEAKSFFLYNEGPTPAVAKCWEGLEAQRRCCGGKGPQDWLIDYYSSNVTQSDAPFEVMKQQCSCSKIEAGICEIMSFEISPNVSQEAMIYSRGCGDIIADDVIHFLLVFRAIVPVTLCVTVVTCIFSLCVTLRVAYLEMAKEDNSMPNRNIGADHSRISTDLKEPQDHPRSSIPDSRAPNPPHPSGRLSGVTGPALYSLNMDGTL